MKISNDESFSVFLQVQLREKAALAKEEAGGLAPLAHAVLEAQKEEQRKAADLAALKRSAVLILHFHVSSSTHFWLQGLLLYVKVSCKDQGL